MIQAPRLELRGLVEISAIAAGAVLMSLVAAELAPPLVAAPPTTAWVEPAPRSSRAPGACDPRDLETILHAVRDNPAEVRVGVPRVIGSIATARVRRMIRRHADQLLFYYLIALSKQPGISGRITIEFTITPAGKVVESTLVESTVNDPTLGERFVRAVRDWEFPAPRDHRAAVVTHPFDRHPGHSSWPAPCGEGHFIL